MAQVVFDGRLARRLFRAVWHRRPNAIEDLQLAACVARADLDGTVPEVEPDRPETAFTFALLDRLTDAADAAGVDFCFPGAEGRSDQAEEL